MEVKANQEFKIFIRTSYQTIVELLNQETLKSSNTVSFIKKEYLRKRGRFEIIDGPPKMNFIFKAGNATNETTVIEIGFRQKKRVVTFIRKYEITIVN